MHTHDSKHDHSQKSAGIDLIDNESRTWRVFILTLIMMIVEIIAGSITGSMALLADGWHMGTHAAAFGIALFAYRFARKHAQNNDFSFGPGKVTTLGGFASAVALAVVAMMMVLESIERFVNPVTIQFNEAIIVAVLGLLVNLISAVMLMGTSLEAHTHSGDHHDHNLRAAYFHVLADALTSMTAIFALVMGKYLGWQFMDPLMGIVGAGVILTWSRGLISSSANVLLDRAGASQTAETIREFLSGAAVPAKVRVWYLAPDRLAATVEIYDPETKADDHYQRLMESHPDLGFLSISHVQQP